MKLTAAVDAFTTHLAQVRRLSPATVRAYSSDLRDLTSSTGAAALNEIDLEMLRDWLWTATQRGDARSTLARRAAAARSFFSWAKDEELIGVDPALRLIAPKRGRTLPQVASQDGIRELLDDSARAAVDGDPIALRDHAILELLYGSGMRVSELCSLDIDDIDLDRATARVLGKGAKERVVPFGRPAREAIGSYLTRGRPGLAARATAAGPAVLLGVRGGRVGARAVYTLVAAALGPESSERMPWAPMRCATLPPRICSMAEPICARCRRSSVTRAWAPRRSTPTSPPNASPRPTDWPIRAREGIAAGEQDGSRHLAEHQHRIDIDAVQPHPDVQRPGCGVSAGCQRADLLACAHDRARREVGLERLEGRDVAVSVIDGDQRPVHDHASERDDPVCGREHRCRSIRSDVDPAVTGAVIVRRGAERLHDVALARDRPAPRRLRRRGSRSGRQHHEEHRREDSGGDDAGAARAPMG